MTSRPKFPFRLPLNYTDGARLEVIHDIDMGEGERVKIIGDPNNAAYEWCVEREDGSIIYSDCSYGISEYALRDGLVAFWSESVDLKRLLGISKRKSKTQLRAYQLKGE